MEDRKIYLMLAIIAVLAIVITCAFVIVGQLQNMQEPEVNNTTINLTNNSSSNNQSYDTSDDGDSDSESSESVDSSSSSDDGYEYSPQYGERVQVRDDGIYDEDGNNIQPKGSMR